MTGFKKRPSPLIKFCRAESHHTTTAEWVILEAGFALHNKKYQTSQNEDLKHYIIMSIQTELLQAE